MGVPPSWCCVATTFAQRVPLVLKRNALPVAGTGSEVGAWTGENVPMEIRTAELRDFGVVGGLRSEFMAEHKGIALSALPDRFHEATQKFIARSHSDGTMVSWLAEKEGDVVGLVSVVLQDVPPRPEDLRTVEGLVINMYVRRSERTKGIGGLLLQACVSSAAQYGIRRLNLYATMDGRPLYSAAGFIAKDDWMVLDLPSHQ
jgi:GNAT superfamily N-acetyltransferase